MRSQEWLSNWSKLNTVIVCRKFFERAPAQQHWRAKNLGKIKSKQHCIALRRLENQAASIVNYTLPGCRPSRGRSTRNSVARALLKVRRLATAALAEGEKGGIALVAETDSSELAGREMLGSLRNASRRVQSHAVDREYLGCLRGGGLPDGFRFWKANH